MDLKLIQKLIQIMRRGELSELELEEKSSGLRVRLKRGAEASAPAPLLHLMHSPTQGVAPLAAPAPAPAESGGAAPAAAEKPAGHTITSPMVGTFYRAASPDAEPFVQVGTRLRVDAPLCIIEAMKVMNEIKSEVAGEVLAVLVENGEPVEFGQPLYLVKLG